MTALRSRLPAWRERVRAGVEHEWHALGLAGRDRSADRGDRVGQGPHPVLEVGTHDADADRPADGLAGVAVSTLQVRADRQVHRGGDSSDHAEHQVGGDPFAVRVAEGGRDRMTGGGQGLRTGDVGDNRRAGHVPDVDDDEELAVVVQPQ